MGQKWRKIRRRCSSFNTGSSGGKGKTSVNGDGDGGGCGGRVHDRGLLLPPSSPSSSEDSTSSPVTGVSAAAAAVHDMLRARLNMLNIGGGGGNKRDRSQSLRNGCGSTRRRRATEAATDTSTFYVPSPLLRSAAIVGRHDHDHSHGEGDDNDDYEYEDPPAADGPCSLPVAFDLSTVSATAADHRLLLRPSSLCRAVETPSSCGSSGRGTADDGAGSDRSSVSYSDNGYNSIASTTAGTGYDPIDR